MDAESLSFADWLRAEMERLNLEPPDIYHRADISRAVVNNWLNGHRIPDPPSCHKLADALGIDPDIVLDAAGHRKLRQPREIYDLESILRQTQEAQQQLSEQERRIREALSGRQVQVTFGPRVPADAVRFIAETERGANVTVPESILGGRSAQRVFIVVASGNCLQREGIVDGDWVFCERLEPGTEPNTGDIVVVRIGDEYSLKIWHRVGDWIELRDGEGTVVHRMSIFAEFDVQGRTFFRSGPMAS